jgi:PhzF family phenazine biosynthesis protein
VHRPFQTIDVFASTPLSGNPLAVVADAEGLDTETMQRITRWLNLSETSFLLPPTDPQADYRVRIFSLDRELPFAGHPTLGTCHAWLAAGGVPRDPARIVQQCEAGLVPIRREADRLAFAAPPLLRSGPPSEAELAEICELLRIPRTAVVDAAWADNGPGWIALLLESAEAVLQVEPLRHWPRHVDIGIVGPHAPGRDAAFEIRALFSDPTGTLVEDPVTGSLNASVAQWLTSAGRATAPYVVAQGTRLDRAGRVFIDRDANGQVWVGGATRTVASGQIDI